jgi:O-antigen biosynthesis protein
MHIDQPFILIPRCVPWNLFQEYLPKIRNRFPTQLHVILESNEANLKSYDPSITVVPYQGLRFLSNDMHMKLSEIVEWKYCTGVVIPWSNMDGTGFENLMGFGRSVAPIPVYVIRPDLTIQQNAPPEVGSSFKVGAMLEGSAEHIYHSRDGRLFICGWVTDQELLPLQPTIALDGEQCRGKSAEIFRYPRPDIPGIPPEKCLGFVIFVSARKKIPTSLSLNYSPVKTIAFGLEGKTTPPRDMLNLAISIINLHQKSRAIHPSIKKQMFNHLRRVLADISHNLGNQLSVSEEMLFGIQPTGAEVSVIIPIYKTYDLLRHQMAAFAKDAFLKKQEILCVLSSIEDADLDISWFRLFSQRLYELYGVPFRVLLPSSECSFSVACNLGATAAQARRLLLLNSDIFPKSAHWLESMISTLDADDSVAVVGARLLYPDDSIQHIGISWRREPTTDNAFVNIHPYKGMSAAIVPHQDVVEVPAVTAACMLVGRELFIDSGMLDTGYIRGDFEDSDYCLRMKKMGKRIVCNHRAELYHIEGVSCASPLRSLLFQINVARHMERWEAAITEILREQGLADAKP